MKIKTGFLLVLFCLLIFTSCENPWMKDILGAKEISFNTNGGSPVPSKQFLLRDETIKKPADPVLADHIFAGWFADNGTFNTQWNFSDYPERDMTLHAKWITSWKQVELVLFEKGEWNTDVMGDFDIKNNKDYPNGSLTVEGNNLVLSADANVYVIFEKAFDASDYTKFVIEVTANAFADLWWSAFSLFNDDQTEGFVADYQEGSANFKNGVMTFNFSAKSAFDPKIFRGFGFDSASSSTDAPAPSITITKIYLVGTASEWVCTCLTCGAHCPPTCSQATCVGSDGNPACTCNCVYP